MNESLNELNQTDFEMFTVLDKPAERFAGEAIANLRNEYPHALDWQFITVATPTIALTAEVEPAYLVFSCEQQFSDHITKTFFVASTNDPFAFEISQRDYWRRLNTVFLRYPDLRNAPEMRNVTPRSNDALYQITNPYIFENGIGRLRGGHRVKELEYEDIPSFLPFHALVLLNPEVYS